MSSAVRSLLDRRSGRAVTSVQTDDQVFATHLWDNRLGVRDLMLCATFRFDDVLDVDVLQKSLWQLLDREGWRKLGGRWRLTEKGRLEIHVPREFTKERPPFRYSHEAFECRLCEHSLASQLPTQGTERETFQTFPSVEHFAPLAFGVGSPRTLQDYLSSDEPLVALHIVSFIDATLVSLTGMHAMSDMMGISGFMRGWCTVMAGRSDMVPALGGVDVDPLEEVFKSRPKPSVDLSSFVLTGWRRVRGTLEMILSSLLPPGPVEKLVCIPARHMRAMQRRAAADLQDDKTSSQDGDADSDAPFISETDLMVGLTQLISLRQLRCTERQSLTTFTAADLRPRLRTAFKRDVVYVLNAITCMTTTQPIADMKHSSLGQLALQHRRTMETQLQEEYLVGALRAVAESQAEAGMVSWAGTIEGFVLSLSDWSRARVGELLDFSPAVVGRPTQKDQTMHDVDAKRRGRPVYWHGSSLGRQWLPMLVCVYGRDRLGNLWLNGRMRPKAWQEFEKYVQGLSESAGTI